MIRWFSVMVLAATCLLGQLAQAQSQNDIVWVQVEAHPNLGVARQRASDFAGRVEDVNGFSAAGGWYLIVLGPYTRADAQQVLRAYRRDSLIPRDSFITNTNPFRQQFFPDGADVLQRGAIAGSPSLAQPQSDEPTTSSAASTLTTTAPDPVEADETPSQARASERLLTGQDRRLLQIALGWAGFYNAAIDGDFGRGTRRAMSEWQNANGFEPTGILTTAQRAALIGAYNAVLEGMDLQLVSDTTAGVEMLVPSGVVAFSKYEYPFAQFDASGTLPAQVLLISQEGDQNTLFGLYDIMQTLEIVPLDGRRERGRSSFLLTGENDRIVSHTEAELRNGQIKGFTLVWPAGDEARRARILQEMRASFRRIDGVLDPSWSDDQDQAVDLISGLQVRRPRLSRSGFFVDDEGRVATTLGAVQTCGRVTLDEDTTAELLASDDTLGLAILSPSARLAPRAVAAFSAENPRLNSEVAAAGFSYEGILGAPTVSYGRLSDVRGLSGEEMLTRLELAMLDGDAGGPVFDETGGVLGMLLPRSDAARSVPEDVSFAADAAAIAALLQKAGLGTRTARETTAIDPVDLKNRARDMTVLVSCWD